MKTSVPTARALRRNPHGDGCVSHLTGRGFAGSITARVCKALSSTKQIPQHEGDETRYRFITSPVVRVIAREHYRALLVCRQEEPADQWLVVGSDGRQGEALQWLRRGIAVGHPRHGGASGSAVFWRNSDGQNAHTAPIGFLSPLLLTTTDRASPCMHTSHHRSSGTKHAPLLA